MVAEEVRAAEGLREYIGQVVFGTDVGDFHLLPKYLFTDIVISDMYVFDSRVPDLVLGKPQGGVIITVNEGRGGKKEVYAL